MQHLALEQVTDELELKGGISTVTAIDWPGKGIGQSRRQRFDGAIVEQDTRKGGQPALFFDWGQERAKEGRGDFGQELFQV